MGRALCRAGKKKHLYPAFVLTGFSCKMKVILLVKPPDRYQIRKRLATLLAVGVAMRTMTLGALSTLRSPLGPGCRAAARDGLL